MSELASMTQTERPAGPVINSATIGAAGATGDGEGGATEIVAVAAVSSFATRDSPPSALSKRLDCSADDERERLATGIPSGERASQSGRQRIVRVSKRACQS